MLEFSREANEMFKLLRKNKGKRHIGDHQNDKGVRDHLPILISAAEARKATGSLPEMKLAQRDFALIARVYMEIWRNGWDITGETGAGLLVSANQAMAESIALETEVGEDYYVWWKRGYIARCSAHILNDPNAWSTAMHDSMRFSQKSLKSPNISQAARRCILAEQAETLVYLGSPGLAIEVIDRILDEHYSTPERVWHIWIKGFALLQDGEPGRAITTMRNVYKDNDTNDLYNNDMRLLLVAANNATGNGTEAGRLMTAFNDVQRDKGERIWTVDLEIDRGAFEPRSPLERAWRDMIQTEAPS